MDVELAVPQTPVGLTPGEETRVSVEVTNHSPGAIALRLSVVPSRAGGWAHTEPASIHLPAGERVSIQLVFRPPATVPPTASLMPFTVRADDLQSGFPAGRATGLLTVSAAERLGAELTAEPGRGRRLTFTLLLDNPGDAPLTVKVQPRLDPPGKRVEAEPAVVDVPAGGTATARVRARPRGRLVGTPAPYAVIVACRDAADGADAPALATVEHSGKVAPRMRRRPATILAAVVLVLATAGGVVVGQLTDLKLPWPGRGTSLGPGRVPEVSKPYALVDVFPRREGPQGYTAAQDAYNRLTAAGMPLKLVDSTSSDVVEDGPEGFWTLLKDGFASAADAQAFCDRYRSIAPKCQVIP
jgi:hypothetical protein